jgi:hypothetical protein
MNKQTSRYIIRGIVRAEIIKSLALLLEKMWTIQDVVRHLQCHKRTFERRRDDWKFPAPDIHEGSFIRWHPETVLNWKKPQ